MENAIKREKRKGGSCLDNYPLDDSSGGHWGGKKGKGEFA